MAGEARAGDGWVKLVGDWISREVGDLAPSFPPEAFAAAIAAAHENGARVTAHCFGTEVLPGLIEAGIDCIEHGTGLTTDLIDQMVEQETALVPTVMQLAKFPEYAAAATRFPAYSATMTDLHRRTRDTLMSAYEAGVALYAGSDGGGISKHGNLAGEVIAMAELGMPGGLRPRRCVLARPRLARLERRPRRGRSGRLRGLPARPARRPVGAPRAQPDRAAGARRRLAGS